MCLKAAGAVDSSLLPNEWRVDRARASPKQRARMARFVQPEAAAAGQHDLRHAAPWLVGTRAVKRDALVTQLPHGALDVVAHQVKPDLAAFARCRVHRKLRRRQGEDEPPASRID